MYRNLESLESIVASFPRCRLVLSQRLLRERLSLHILTVVCIEGLTVYQ